MTSKSLAIKELLTPQCPVNTSHKYPTNNIDARNVDLQQEIAKNLKNFSLHKRQGKHNIGSYIKTATGWLRFFVLALPIFPGRPSIVMPSQQSGGLLQA